MFMMLALLAKVFPRYDIVALFSDFNCSIHSYFRFTGVSFFSYDQDIMYVLYISFPC